MKVYVVLDTSTDTEWRRCFSSAETAKRWVEQEYPNPVDTYVHIVEFEIDSDQPGRKIAGIWNDAWEA